MNIAEKCSSLLAVDCITKAWSRIVLVTVIFSILIDYLKTAPKLRKYVTISCWPSIQTQGCQTLKASEWNAFVRFISYQVSPYRYLMSPKTNAVTAKPLLGQPDSALGLNFWLPFWKTSHMINFFHLPGFGAQATQNRASPQALLLP